MATLYVDEISFTALAKRTIGPAWQGAQAPQYPPIASQTLVISGSSNPSNPFAATTTFIRVHTDAICSIAIGPSPTAVGTATRLAANQTEYFGVTPGHSIAVITNV